MRRVAWAERQTGDCFLSAVPGFLHDGIWLAEKAMHPDAPLDFAATHAGIIGFPVGNDGTVIEAWLDTKQNSVAAINFASKYETWASLNDVEVWHPAKFAEDALKQYLQIFGPEHYGVLNLFGFEYLAFVKELTGRDIENPLEKSQVCSQGVGDFLSINEGYTGAEQWIFGANIPNLDPLALRMLFLSHQH